MERKMFNEEKKENKKPYRTPTIALVEMKWDELAVMQCQTPSGSGSCCTSDVS